MIPTVPIAFKCLQEVIDLLGTVDEMKLCFENPDEQYSCHLHHQGNLYDQSGKYNNNIINEIITFNYWFNKLGTKVIARLDSRTRPRPTIQHVTCSLLLAEPSDKDRCKRCITYRKTLAKVASRKADKEASAHSRTNHIYLIYLSSPQKVARIKELQHKNRVSQKRIDRLSKNIEELKWGVLGQ